jgi:hypothetical protein
MRDSTVGQRTAAQRVFVFGIVTELTLTCFARLEFACLFAEVRIFTRSRQIQKRSVLTDDFIVMRPIVAASTQRKQTR